MNRSPGVSANIDPIEVERRNWAGEPAILLGEDAEGYRQLLAQVSRALAPRDVLEDIWMRDVVDLSWDVFRLRRLKANLFRARARQAMGDLLDDVVNSGAWNLSKSWHARDAAAVAQVDAALKSSGMTMDTVMAATLGAEIDAVERIETLIASAESRRSLALVEIERYRASFAQSLREAIDQAAPSDAPAAAIVPQLPAAGSGA